MRMRILTDELERAKTKMSDLKFEKKRLLDVINEKDEVIGEKPRNEIHDLGLLHREIHVWMFDQEKNIFFQKRGLHRPAAGLLDATVGGHTNKGESYLEAAVRETKEETGIEILPENLILLGKLKNTLEPGNNVLRSIYICNYPVSEDKLKKEGGVPGAGFQKLSYTLLYKPEKDLASMFLSFVLLEEIPLVLKYINEQNF